MDIGVKVSIIIVNYNTKELTLNCINSIFSKTKYISFEIILVDNASNDGSKEIFEKDKRIKYIYNYVNLGFGEGNNVGSKYAKGVYLLFLNPDTILVNNAIYILSEFMDLNPSVIACGGNIYDSDGNPSHSFRRYFPGIRWEINLATRGLYDKLVYGKNSEFNYTENNMEVGYITGADLMIRESIFKECKGFSKDYFMYYEETDLCFRAKSSQTKIYSVPNAKIIHLEGKSFSLEKLIQRRGIIEKSYRVYRTKNFKLIQRMTCDVIHNIMYYIKSIYYNLLTKKER